MFNMTINALLYYLHQSFFKIFFHHRNHDETSDLTPCGCQMRTGTHQKTRFSKKATIDRGIFLIFGQSFIHPMGSYLQLLKTYLTLSFFWPHQKTWYIDCIIYIHAIYIGISCFIKLRPNRPCPPPCGND